MSQLNAIDLKNRATQLKTKLDSLSASGTVTHETLNEVDRQAAKLAKDLQELSDWLTRKEEAAAVAGK
jgi:ABC-type phosphate transport system auxiliary subunit